MLEFLDRARRYLWAFVELGFLVILASLLIYLILGERSGVFIISVADNVMNFADDVPTPSLLGLGVLLAIIYLVARRMDPPPGPTRRSGTGKTDR